MPSPFPGMDPYLESPDWFPDLHGSLITHMKEALQPSPARIVLRPVRLDRFWLEYSQQSIEPDVERRPGSETGPKAEPWRGGRRRAPRSSGPLIITVETIEHGPFKQSFLEIRHRRGKDVRLVTAIEILSPSNKKVGHAARDLYIDKQREVLASDANLVEIDLLRGGTHTAAVPRELVEAKAGPFDYLVSIHRFDRPQRFPRLSDLHDSASPPDRDPPPTRRPGRAARHPGGVRSRPTTAAPTGATSSMARIGSCPA